VDKEAPVAALALPDLLPDFVSLEKLLSVEETGAVLEGGNVGIVVLWVAGHEPILGQAAAGIL
jgi:hypothetical protein